jgi:hypothetical protein
VSGKANAAATVVAQVRIYDMQELLGKKSHATQREMLRWLGVQVRASVLGGVVRHVILQLCPRRCGWRRPTHTRDAD